MDIAREVLRDHSKAMVSRVVKYVGNDPTRFASLVQVYLDGPFRVTQYSAWPLTYCSEQHPELIRPHFKKILDNLDKPGIHDAAKRNTVRMLQFVVIPPRYIGKVTDICFRYLQDKKEPVAVKVFSMSVLANITVSEPDLRQELKIIIEDLYPFGSGAFRSRARKVLKQLNAS